VNTRNCDTVVAGIQFGVMGCLSTVSTFAAEFNKMRLSSDPWTAYAYAAITISSKFGCNLHPPNSEDDNFFAQGLSNL
ncbi:CrcB-like protein, partial [Trifolium medium]|nr:CrcB-like protein [Trifolium medium]